MMGKKTKILGIAPYESMRTLMLRIAELRDDIELTVYVGDMEEGAEIASRHTLQDFDIILSRGGTAELISSISPIPVVEIQLSVYDILRAIKLAENYTDRYAIVGFPGITKNAQFLCDLLQYDIDICPVHNSEEVYQTLARLKDKEYHMVLCDVITNTQAQQFGIRSILITSGTESIEASFDQAVQTADTYRALVSKSEFFETLLEDYLHHVFVYDEKGNLVYTSKEHNFSPAVMTAMKNYVPDILAENEKKFYRDEDGILVAVKGIRKCIHKQIFIAYYVNTRKVPLSLIKNGIRYIDKAQALDQFYTSIYSLATSLTPFRLALEEIAPDASPIMILGEDGTGKEQMAGYLYAMSSFSNKPQAIIDCSRITDKSWTFLTEHTNSPLSDTETTIYLREIQFLSDRQFRELFAIIRDLDLCRRNRIIFSCTIKKDEPPTEQCQLLINHFNCTQLRIPPLRQSLSELPNLANICISNLNMQLAREIVGLEPDALKLLQTYDWPHNYDQLRRILQELVTMTDTPYVKAASVTRLLLREKPPVISSAGTVFNLNQTLEEINLDIIRHVLAEEGGNQSQAAKRLGISRSTLWRMLQKIQE